MRTSFPPPTVYHSATGALATGVSSASNTATIALRNRHLMLDVGELIR